MAGHFSPKARAALAALLLALPFAGCAGVKPTLGEPRAGGTFIYQPPPGGRFDYIVYVSNADRRMADRPARVERVRRLMADRCVDPWPVDLYAHEMGLWPDGSTHISYTVGVDCGPHEGEVPP